MDRSKAMEAAHTQRSQEIAPFRNVAERWAPYLQQNGATADMMFDSLMRVEYQLRTGTEAQRIQLLHGVAQQYGINLNPQQEAQAPTAEEDPLGIHKHLEKFQNPIMSRLEQLEGGLSQLSGGLRTNVSAQQQQSVAAAQTQITKFRSEQGADGKSAHPHFDEVEAEMASLAQIDQANGIQPNIPSLYERACWLNPAVRTEACSVEHSTGIGQGTGQEQEGSPRGRRFGRRRRWHWKRSARKPSRFPGSGLRRQHGVGHNLVGGEHGDTESFGDRHDHALQP